MGPPVGLVATFPADGAGTDCLPNAPAECGVRVDTTLEFRFDRFLLPASINRQAFTIYTGDPGNVVGNLVYQDAPQPIYDVVERVVTIRFGEGVFLQPHTLYTVELLVPKGDQVYGFRAVDRAPISDAKQPLRFSFYTSGLTPEELEAVPDPNPVLQEPEFTCSDILGWFQEGTDQGQCAACHDDPKPPMGLRLVSGSDLRATAIDQVAHQTDLGGTTGEAYENSVRFGFGMPRIEPEQPNNSYLLYKLLVKPENYRRSPTDAETCETVHRVELAGECEPSPEEISRMRNWFVLGEPMPMQAASTERASLYRSKLRGIQSWIRAGAHCELGVIPVDSVMTLWPNC